MKPILKLFKMIFPPFNPPPSNLKLNDDEIHVWKASLDQPQSIVHTVKETLSMDEKKIAERFHFEQDRKRFVVCRGILRAILGGYLSVEPSRVQFCYGKHGKPDLADTFEKERIRFNLSHSEDLAVYVFTLDRDIGVDIEYIRDIPEIERIVQEFFSLRENALFRELPKSAKKEAFFKFWTSKEAFLKATGYGLSLPLEKLDVTLLQGESAEIPCIEGNSKGESRWSIQEFKPSPGFAAALAIEARST